MPVPMAVMMDWISTFLSAWSSRAFSTFRILPRMGRMAWKVRLRASLAEPPAEFPSTMNSSAWRGSREEQSASLPGSEEDSSSDLRLVSSRALRAAMRARAAWMHLTTIALAWGPCSSNHSSRARLVVCWTNPLMSVLPSLVLVWPSNWGSRSFTETIAVRPSRTSSPLRLGSFSLSRALLRGRSG